jgi:hypothetical protein
MNTTLKAKRVTAKDLVGDEFNLNNFINSQDQSTEDGKCNKYICTIRFNS